MGMGIYGSKQKSDRIMKLLMGGEANTDFLGVSSLTQMSRQKCKNLFISMSFKEKSLTWKDTAVNEWNHIGIGPSYYPTDFGACCLFVPHIDFEGKNLGNKNYGELYHKLNATSLNGQSNGLRQKYLNT